ncbi:MAG: TonB-dependent receptor [Rubrivivax sp.]
MSTRRSSRQVVWRRGLIAAAVGMALASGAVYAQESAGSINGRAKAGAAVSVTNASIGINRTTTATGGTYSMGQLPPGTYVISVTNPDGSKDTRTIDVAPGVGSTINFDDTQQITVTGQARTIDVKSTETTQILKAEELDRIPVARDVTSIALLAPTATLGDSRLGTTNSRAGNIPSLGGASPAENTYYVNGFNVTNIVNGVAFNQVPSGAVASQEVKTGGYGAQWGRSLGGVLSVVTKRGTNEWHGGVSAVIQPESWRGSSVYAEKEGDTKWTLKNRPGGTTNNLYSLWVGGPIIKDKLFVFGVVEAVDYKNNTYGASTQTETTNKEPQYLLKVDWNLTDSNLIEFTAFSDKPVDKVKTWKSPEAYKTAKGDFLGNDRINSGGNNFIGAWTSQITDDLSIKALVGQGTYDRNSSISAAACPIVQDVGVEVPGRTTPKGCYTATIVTDPKAKDERTAYRLDGEWILGAHTLRAGLDYEKYDVLDGTSYSGVSNPDFGPSLYQIRRLAVDGKLANGYVNTSGAPMDYVRFRSFQNGGQFTTINSAWYLEDTFQATKDLVLYAGIRNESFENQNADGTPFIKIKNTWAPRLGASWDIGGKADMKLFGTWGRYYIPVYANTNVRLSGAELDYQEFYAYGGSLSNDQYQIPALGTELGTRAYSSDGNTPDPRSVVDPKIKPMFQDEITLGFEKALANRWTAGVKYIHRDLKSAMDDICNDEGAYNWAISAGYTADQADTIAGAIGHCFLYNPGGKLTADLDIDGTGEFTRISIPAADLAMPKPKRTYDALEFSVSRPWDGKWMLNASYVWAKSKGNTEGYVKSDIGQDDAGISQDFDYPGLMEGSTGYLPNDRRHTIKVFGSYAVTEEWRVGANFLWQSGRPKNCFGVYAGTLDGVSALYGDASFWCKNADGVDTLNTRGSLGRLPSITQLDLQAAYEPRWVKGLTLAVDVLNVFDKRTVRGIEEGESSGMFDANSIYGRPLLTSLQRPRTIKLTAKYEF